MICPIIWYDLNRSYNNQELNFRFSKCVSSLQGSLSAGSSSTENAHHSGFKSQVFITNFSNRNIIIYWNSKLRLSSAVSYTHNSITDKCAVCGVGYDIDRKNTFLQWKSRLCNVIDSSAFHHTNWSCTNV